METLKIALQLVTPYMRIPEASTDISVKMAKITRELIAAAAQTVLLLPTHVMYT
jgi:hypothetical protein